MYFDIDEFEEWLHKVMKLRKTIKMEITDNLKLKLTEAISKANEVRVAVALANEAATDLLKTRKTNCDVNIVVGVDLPTSIDVLKELRSEFGDKSRIYLQHFFHPKVYLFRFGNGHLKAFVGSANFTSGGLEKNVEMSIAIDDQSVCNELLKWFNGIYEEASPITDLFLRKYKPYEKKYRSTRQEQEDDFDEIAEEMSRYAEQEKRIKNDLLNIRKDSIYKVICNDRREAVLRIKNALDYDNDFRHIDVPAYLNILELGKIRRGFQGKLAEYADNGSLRKICKFLCNESIDISKRLDATLKGGSKHLSGWGVNNITKLLCINEPKLYFVYNNAIQSYLDKVGLGMSGEMTSAKYVTLLTIFKRICKELDIKDFAVLDEMLIRCV